MHGKTSPNSARSETVTIERNAAQALGLEQEKLIWQEDLGIYNVYGGKLVDGVWIPGAREDEAIVDAVTHGEIEISFDVEKFIKGEKYTDDNDLYIVVRLTRPADASKADISAEDNAEAQLYMIAEGLLYTKDKQCSDIERINISEYAKSAAIDEVFARAYMTDNEIDFDKIEASLPQWKEKYESCLAKQRAATSAQTYYDAFVEKGVPAAVIDSELLLALKRSDFNAENGGFAFDVGDCGELRLEPISRAYYQQIG